MSAGIKVIFGYIILDLYQARLKITIPETSESTIFNITNWYRYRCNVFEKLVNAIFVRTLTDHFIISFPFCISSA